MAHLARLVPKVKSVAPAARSRSPHAEWFGFDPFDLFRNFQSSPSLDVGLAQDSIDITRNESGYTVDIPVAGYKPDQIEVTITDGVLSIVANSDRRSFSRSLVLPEEIDAGSVSAHVENGLLSLTLHQISQAQPKRIPVTS